MKNWTNRLLGVTLAALVALLGSVEVLGQSLTVNTSGNTGTSGAGWSSTDNGTTVTISVTGSAVISPTVLTTALNAGKNVFIAAITAVFDHGFTTTNASSVRLTIKTTQYIVVQANASIVSSNAPLDLVFWADSDNSQNNTASTSNDEILLSAGVNIITNGGLIHFAGGLDNGANGGVANDNLPDGYAYRGAAGGIGGLQLGAPTTTGTTVVLASNGGNITLRGMSGGTAAGARPGITSQASFRIDAGFGKVDLQGFSTVGHGIEFTYGVAPEIGITSAFSGSGPAVRIAGGTTLTGGYKGILLFNSLTGNFLVQSASSTGGGILLEAGSDISANTGYITTQPNSAAQTQFLSGAGDIEIRSAAVGASVATGALELYGNMRFGTLVNATAVAGVVPSVTTSQANVKLVSNAPIFDPAGTNVKVMQIATTGTVSILPVSTSFSAAQTIRNLSLTNVSGLTFGASDNTSAVTVGQALNVAGPITVFGGDVTIDNPVTTTTATGHQRYVATGNVLQNASDVLTTSGGSVILWADADGNGAGYVKTLANITTNGGHVYLGGGSASETVNGLTVPSGYATSTTNTEHGVDITGSTISTGGGDLRAKGNQTSVNGENAGVHVSNATIQTGAGDLELHGNRTGDPHASSGLYLGTVFSSGTATGNVRLESTSGNIVLTGTVDGTSVHSWCHGFAVVSRSGDDIIIQSTSGNISMTGTATDATGANGESQGLVIHVEATNGFFSATTDGGTLTINGDGANNLQDYGVDFRSGGAADNIRLGDANTGSITVRASSLRTASTTAGGTVFTSAGGYTLEGYNGLSFESAVTVSTNYSFATSGTSFRLGSTGNTQNVTLEIPVTVAGPISVYGAAVSVSKSLISTTASDITVAGTVGVSTPSSTTQIEFTSANGNILVDANSDANTDGLLEIDYVIFNAGSGTTTVRGYTMGWSTVSNTAKPNIRGTGAFVFEPSGTSFGQGVNTVWFFLDADANGIGGVTVGKVGNVANLSQDHAGGLTVAGPVALLGGSVDVTTALNASGQNVSLHGTGVVTQASAITAAGLNLSGTAAFTLTNTSNNIGILAGGTSGTRLGNVNFVNSAGFTVGTVTQSGIQSSGTVLLESTTGNITLAQSIATTNAGTTAVTLNAGKSMALGNALGGNILVSGTPTVTTGTNGIVRLFSGREAESTGLTALAGGTNNARYFVDETTSTFSPVLANGNRYALYRYSISELGGVTVVASGGVGVNNGWEFVNNTILPTSASAVSINASVVEGYLNTSPLTVQAGSFTVTGALSSSSSNGFTVDVNGAIAVNNSVALAGPISWTAGGTLTVAGNITSTGNNDVFLKSRSSANPSIVVNSTRTITKANGTGTLTFQAHGRVQQAGTVTTSGTGVLNVVVWSDFDNTNNDGGVSVMGPISTNGGHVWLGGSSTNGGSYTWNGLAVGDGPSVASAGYNANAMDVFANITTNGGDFLAWAGETGSGIANDGNGDIVDVGSGDVVLITDYVFGAGNFPIYFKQNGGTITLVPENGSYPKTFLWDAFFETSFYNAPSYNFNDNFNYFALDNPSSLQRFTIGYYDGMLNGSTPVVFTNSTPVTFTTAAALGGALQVYGGALTLSANVSTSSTTLGDVVLSGTSLTGTGNLAVAAGRTATLSVSSASTYDGVVSGTGSNLTKLGAGTLTLSKDHTYSGATQINAGALQVGTGGSLSQASSGSIANTSGVVVASGAKLVLAPNENVAFDRAVSGDGGVEISGQSGAYYSLFLTTSWATLAANTTVLEALTRITGARQNGQAVASGITKQAGAYIKQFNAAANTATFEFQQYDGVYTKVVFVKLRQNGNNVEIAINTTPYNTGAGYIQANVLGTSLATGGSSMPLATSNGSGSGYGIDQVYLSGKVNFTGNLTYTGTTTLTSNTTTGTGSNTYSYVSKGTQEIKDGSSSFPGAVVNNGLVVYNRSTPLTISANMSGTEEILQVGAAITLTGTNTYSGLTTVDLNKTLSVGAGGTTGTLASNVVNYGTLTFDRSDASTYAGVVSGSGALVKSGAGVLTLTGLPTLTGTTTINAGELVVERNVPAAWTGSIGGAGIFRIQPAAASFTSTTGTSGWNLGSTLGGFVLGKVGNTSTVQVNSTVSIAGPITLYGGTVNATSAATTTGAGSAIRMESSGAINLSAALNTNGGPVVLWANNDGSGTAFVRLANTTTNGGSIWAGGGSGSRVWNGVTVGNSFVNYGTSGSGIYVNGTLDTRVTATPTVGGDIMLCGGTENGVSFADITAETSTRSVLAGNGDIALLSRDGVYIFSGSGIVMALETTGSVSLAPVSGANWLSNWDFLSHTSVANSFTGNGSGLWGVRVMFPTTLGGLNLGTYSGTGLAGDDAYVEANTQDISISSDLSTGGSVHVFGGTLNVGAHVASTRTSGDGVTFEGSRIVQNGGHDVTTNGANILYNVSNGVATSSSDHLVSVANVNDNALINANGGSIQINSVFQGGSTGNPDRAVNLMNAKIETSGAGTVSIHADARANPNTSVTAWGIQAYNSKIISESGGINIDAWGGRSTVNSRGLAVDNSEFAVLSVSGPIRIEDHEPDNLVGTHTGLYFAPNAANAIVLGANGTDVASSSSSVELVGNKLTFSVNPTKISTSGTVTVVPEHVAFAQALNTQYLDFGSGSSGITVGKSTNTSDVTLGAAVVASGDITVYGGTLTLNGNLTSTNGAVSLYSDSPLAGLSSTSRSVNAGGLFRYAPQGATFNAAVTFPITNLSVTANGLILGKLSNASDITLASALTVNGPVQLYGDDLVVSAGLTAAGDVLFDGATLDANGNVKTNVKSTGAASNVTLDVATASFAPGTYLWSSGGIANNGALTLEAENAADGAYSQMKFGGAFTAGAGSSIIQQQYLEEGRHLMGSPFAAGTAAFFGGNNPGQGGVGSSGTGYPSGNMNLFGWSGSDWEPLENNNSVIASGKGYIGSVGTNGFRLYPGVQSFTGTLPNASTTVSILKEPAESGVTVANGLGRDGWNLIANPFPCAIDATNIASAGNGLNGAVYRWNPRSNSNNGAYEAHSPAGLHTDNHIAPLQAFWVQATTAGQVTLSMNTHGTVLATPVFRKTTDFEADRFRLEVVRASQPTYKDVSYIALAEGTTDGFDAEWDAHKLASGDRAVYLYSHSLDGAALANNAVSYSSEATAPKQVPLAFRAPGHGETFSLQLDATAADGDYDVFVEDLVTGMMYDLASAAYSFVHDSTVTERFIVHFRSAKARDFVQAGGEEAPLNVWTRPGELVFWMNQPATGRWTLMGLDGKEIQFGKVVLDGTSVHTAPIDAALPHGVYLVRTRLANGSTVFVRVML